MGSNVVGFIVPQSFRCQCLVLIPGIQGSIGPDVTSRKNGAESGVSGSVIVNGRTASLIPLMQVSGT
jgi:hypothetical protein